MRRLVLLFAAFSIAGGIKLRAADPVSIFEIERFYTAPQSQTIDPPLKVGDVIRFRWIGERKPGVAATKVAAVPGQRLLSEEGWEIYSHPKDDPTSAFSVIPIKSGDLTLPELQIEDPDGKVLGKTRSMALKVASAGEEGGPPPELLPPQALRFPKKWIWISVISLLVTGIFSWFFWRRFRRRRRKSNRSVPVGVSKGRLSEHDEAFQELDKLEKQRWIAQGEFKKHYFGISEIIKQYIERRYGVHALEATTREMVLSLESAGIQPDSVRPLSELFEKLDRVKFTDFIPPAGDSEPEEVLNLARGWVQKTRVRVEVSRAP